MRLWLSMAALLLCACSGVPGAAAAQEKEGFLPLLREAESRFQRGDLAGAQSGFEALVKSHPGEPQPFWYLGVIAFEQKDHERAGAAFAELVGRQPERGAGWTMLGLSMFRAGRFDEALPHIERGRFLGGTGNSQIDHLAAVTQAMLCNRIGRFDVALAVLSELAIQGATSPAIVATFGLAALNRSQMLDEVRREEQPLVMAAGEAAWAIGAKKTEDSIRLAEALLSRFPDARGLHFVLGTALLRNDWERAEKELRAEVAANPGHFFANVTLATELIERNRMEDALPFARKAVELRGDHFVAQTLLGRAMLGTGQVAEAVRCLEEAVKLAPENRNARYSLALAYARAGRKEEAERQRQIFAQMQESQEAKP